jgi:hypothetical protein
MTTLTEMNANERKYYRIACECADMVVGGYENMISDGYEVTIPSIASLMGEVYFDVENELKRTNNDQLHFIGLEKMDELLRAASRKALANADF